MNHLNILKISYSIKIRRYLMNVSSEKPDALLLQLRDGQADY